ncbi:MAG: FAD-dependent oxidoreductase [Pseudolabrys sp.]|nr:FAD-dependent oxidoreductase [Pseudolabrys sp.]
MIRPLTDIHDEYDVVVAGAGAGGMAAALYAAIAGQRVLLIEHTEYLGGTTALSAGSVWAPNTRHAEGSGDTPNKAPLFLDNVVGNYARPALRRAFLDSAPDAIAALEDNSDVKFRAYPMHPDYVQEVDGASLRGRALEALPFDGRELGKAFALLRPPIPEFTILGGMMVSRVDIDHLLKLTKSASSFVHAVKLLARHARDRLRHPRGTRLVMGNALVGRFVKSLLDRNVDIVMNTSVTALQRSNGAVVGVTLKCGDVVRDIGALKAVILAGGGFIQHTARREAMLAKPVPAFSPSAPGSTGELQDLALALGARFSEGTLDNTFWAPVSLRQRADGSTAVFPHFVFDRSKPGTVCVNSSGKRFVNESTSYHLFARAMFDAHKRSPSIPAFLIADAVALKRYGLGMVRPGGYGLKPFLADGYLVKDATLRGLAGQLGIDANNLEHTVAAMNGYAKTGVDPEFNRGSTAYHRNAGDPAVTPNPNLGPIDTAPFYAIRLVPGDIGAASGLVTSEDAQVLGHNDVPIARLYACGADMQSVMGGTYPGPGITLGPAITFAWRAIRHALKG